MESSARIGSAYVFVLLEGPRLDLFLELEVENLAKNLQSVEAASRVATGATAVAPTITLHTMHSFLSRDFWMVVWRGPEALSTSAGQQNLGRRDVIIKSSTVF